MRRVIEILLAHFRDDGVDRVVIEQNRGQDRLLRLDVVGRDAAMDLVSMAIGGVAHTAPPVGSASKGPA
jgi:hypothetical protein